MQEIQPSSQTEHTRYFKESDTTSGIEKTLEEINAINAPIVELEQQIDGALETIEEELREHFNIDEHNWLESGAVQIETSKLFGFEPLEEEETIDTIISQIVFSIEHTQHVAVGEFESKLEIFKNERFGRLRQSIQELESLRSQFGRVIAIKLLEAAQQFKKSLDIQSIIGTSVASPTSKLSLSIFLGRYIPDLLSVIGVFSGLEEDSHDNNTQLYQRIFNPLGLFNRFITLRTVFSEYLVVHTDNLNKDSINVEEFHQEIRSTKTALEETKTYFTLFERNSKGINSAFFEVEQLEFVFEDNRIIDLLRTHPDILQSIKDFLENRIKEWKNTGILQKTEQEQDAIEGDYYTTMNFEFRLPKPKSDQLLIISQHMVHNFILNSIIPNAFFKGIGRVQFVDRDSTPRGDYPNEITEYDRISASLLDHQNREYLYKRLFHEVLEHARTVIGVEDMRAWDEVLQKESSSRAHISWYSRYSEANPELKSWKKEDFCDSGAMYVVSPSELIRLSPERFRYFVLLFAKYLPSNMRTQYIRHQMQQLAEVQQATIPIQETSYEKMDHDDFVEKPGEKPKARTIAQHVDRSHLKKPESKIEGDIIVVTGPVFTPNLNM